MAEARPSARAVTRIAPGCQSGLEQHGGHARLHMDGIGPDEPAGAADGERQGGQRVLGNDGPVLIYG